MRAQAGRLLVPVQMLRLGRAVTGQRTCWTLCPLPTAPSLISGWTLSSGVHPRSGTQGAMPSFPEIMDGPHVSGLGRALTTACSGCLRVSCCAMPELAKVLCAQFAILLV